MDRSLLHIPLRKRDELDKILNAIHAASCDVKMVILFGSYARGTWKEAADLMPNRISGNVSDYDILVITGNKSSAYDTVLWEDVDLECRSQELSTYVRIIVRDIEFVNNRLAEGQYFFKDIIRDGRLLYDSGDVSLDHEKKFTPSEKRLIAKGYYDEWFESAKNFFKVFEFCFREKDYKLAAFQLHQATEAAYKTLLLVLTNYCPHEHYLGVLGLLAESEDHSLRGIFPQDTKEQRDRFKRFDYAYIGARYDQRYTISKEDLDYCSDRVRQLLKLVEKSCQIRL